MTRRPPIRHLAVAAGLGLLALALAWITGGLSPSLFNPDEGGHYVNALFLGDWIRAGFPAPMDFAKAYYAHFPRLSIGHWPPGWYMVEAPLFALLHPTPLFATALSAFVAGLPGMLVYWAMRRIGRPGLGIALAAAYVLLPLTIESGRFILLDQPVALVVGLGAIAWVRASEDPRWWRFLVFAAFAAFAPLTKGNGALIALVPAIHIALGSRWALLRHPALWVAATLTMLVVAPWYWISFKISAGGFNYAPGLEYAWLAFAANLTAIWSNIGPVGIGLAAFGAWRGLRAQGPERRVAEIAVAVTLATLLFQSLVPAALEARYISPLLPWLVALIGLGLVPLLERSWMPALALGALAPAAIALWTLPAKPDLRASEHAQHMADKGGIWLVDGRAGGEGALIAAAAHADDGRNRIWVTRASQWLSSSDFMGRGYRLSVADPAETRAVLDRLGAAGVVSVAEHRAYAYPHSRLLHQAILTNGYARHGQAFAAGEGATLEAVRTAPVHANVALVEGSKLSSNATKLGGALP